MSIFNVIIKVVPSRKIRRTIFGFLLKPLSENMKIKLLGLVKTGRMPNLTNPKRFSDKCLVYPKVYKTKEFFEDTNDKFKIREYVTKLGGAKYLTKMYCIEEKVDDINFDILPDSFVIKDTKGDFAREVLVVKSKKTMGTEKIKKIVNGWNKSPSSKIIVEEMLPRDDNGDFYDYKFFCFNGVAKCLYVVLDEKDGTHSLSFYDLNFNNMHVSRPDYLPPIKKKLEKPRNWNKMIEVAEMLSKDLPHARVDLYNINGQVYFGELTLCTAAGYSAFEPDSVDFELGSFFDLESIMKKG